jgi:hypothetical protein
VEPSFDLVLKGTMSTWRRTREDALKKIRDMIPAACGIDRERFDVVEISTETKSVSNGAVVSCHTTYVVVLFLENRNEDERVLLTKFINPRGSRRIRVLFSETRPSPPPSKKPRDRFMVNLERWVTRECGLDRERLRASNPGKKHYRIKVQGCTPEIEACVRDAMTRFFVKFPVGTDLKLEVVERGV